MLISMTGFGQGIAKYNHKQIKVEIKALNAKSTDIRVKLPNLYRSKEIELRKRILQSVSRGKIDMTIHIISELGEEEYNLNTTLIKKYYKNLMELQQELQFKDSDLMQAILRIPHVVDIKEEAISEQEWNTLLEATDIALSQLAAFRTKEGQALELDLLHQVESIQEKLNNISQYEQERIEKIRTRLHKNLDQFLAQNNVDHNRMEQEMIFYIEKLDITEEKIRLAQHCRFFKDELQNQTQVKGKKLAFISQEMGREINTLGAKAQHSEMQQLVVSMKEALEKIKEQMANIL